MKKNMAIPLIVLLSLVCYFPISADSIKKEVRDIVCSVYCAFVDGRLHHTY